MFYIGFCLRQRRVYSGTSLETCTSGAFVTVNVMLATVKIRVNRVIRVLKNNLRSKQKTSEATC
jgi:hypothetical protein